MQKERHKCYVSSPPLPQSEFGGSVLLVSNDIVQGANMLRVQRRTYIIFSTCLILGYIFFYFTGGPDKIAARLSVKLALSALLEERQPHIESLDSRNLVSPLPSLLMGAENTTGCSSNYILSVWDQKKGALGNKMSDYASLIGHARRLKLRPYIYPSMKKALSKIFK